MPIASILVRVAAAALLLPIAHSAAIAQDPADFYRDKAVDLLIGGPNGSDEDIYGHLVGKYLGRHIAGLASVFVANMAGNGGYRAGSYVYSAAADNGTAIGIVPPEVITAPLWLGLASIPNDPTRLVFLGSASSESTDCFVNGDSPVKSLRDVFVGEVTMGALVDGGPTRDGPILLNALLGTKFRVVAKYADTSAILDAIVKGEVTGACGLTWSSVSTRHPDWLLKGVLRGLVQESATGARLLTRLGVPLATDFAASAEDRQVMALAYAQQAFGRPFILPPGTPLGRISVLRTAFLATLKDKDLLAEAKQASLKIDPLPGDAVAALVAQLYAAPAATLERVRAALSGGVSHGMEPGDGRPVSTFMKQM